ERTFRLFAVTGVCSVDRVARDCLRDRNPLFGYPAAFRLAVSCLASYGALEARPWIHCYYLPIASEGQTRPRLLKAMPSPREFCTFQPNVAAPNVHVGDRLSVQRLHAGDDSERSEARQVVRRNRFNVFD